MAVRLEQTVDSWIPGSHAISHCMQIGQVSCYCQDVEGLSHGRALQLGLDREIPAVLRRSRYLVCKDNALGTASTYRTGASNNDGDAESVDMRFLSGTAWPLDLKHRSNGADRTPYAVRPGPRPVSLNLPARGMTLHGLSPFYRAQNEHIHAYCDWQLMC